MSDHSHFESLAALAAGGHLSPEECAELRRHLDTCVQCREHAKAYSDLVAEGLPLTRSALSADRALATATPAADGRARFLARARSEGIPLSAAVDAVGPVQAAGWSPLWQIAASLALVALGAAATALVFSLRGSDDPATSSSEVVRLRQETVELNGKLAARDKDLAEQQEQLRQVRARLDAALGATGDLRRTQEQHDQQLGRSTSEVARLAEELTNRDRQLADASDEIARITQLRASDRASIEAQRTRIRNISYQLRLADATLEMERQLAASGKDILTLTSARQLRVVDVRDTDASGRARPAFARVFVSDGQSIRIFAFDLEQGRSAPPRFQVWGESGADGAIRNLGVLAIDDRSQNRWSLDVADASIKDLDSVFVTASSQDAAPAGPRLLYTYLGQAAD